MAEHAGVINPGNVRHACSVKQNAQLFGTGIKILLKTTIACRISNENPTFTITTGQIRK